MSGTTHVKQLLYFSLMFESRVLSILFYQFELLSLQFSSRMQRNYGALVSAVCTLNCLQMIEKKFMVLIDYDLIIFPLYF